MCSASPAGPGEQGAHLVGRTQLLGSTRVFPGAEPHLEPHQAVSASTNTDSFKPTVSNFHYAPKPPL